MLNPYVPSNAEDTEINCLIRNVYYEARGESVKGQLAVALVTLNRVDSKVYPASICDVVYQKYQFSWTKLPKLSKINPAAWVRAEKSAKLAYSNRNILGSFKATHFHSNKVLPGWNLNKVATIGNHIFYKDKHARSMD